MYDAVLGRLGCEERDDTHGSKAEAPRIKGSNGEPEAVGERVAHDVPKEFEGEGYLEANVGIRGSSAMPNSLVCERSLGRESDDVLVVLGTHT